MGRENRQLFRLMASALILCVLTPLASTPGKVRAQNGETQDSPGIGQQLIISSSDTSSAPTIHLRAFGLDSQGAPLELTPEVIQILHDGQQVSDVAIVGTYKAGTFTIFVVDVPPGVEAQLPAIQASIEQYTSPPEMEEPVDYAAIYQVGESEANLLLKPSNFYNDFRNFFASPLETQSGPTALVDSLVTLLNDVANITPKDGILTTLVVMSDGTDVVSSLHDAEDVGQLAAELGIPIHTVWLENNNLQPSSHEVGKAYLAQISAESGGVASRVDRPEEVQVIWDRIASFRNHDVIQYRPTDLGGGIYQVDLSLRNDLSVSDSVTIRIAETSPTIQIDLPPEDRQLIIDNLDKPISLTLSTVTSWLDGEKRELTGAQLLVNGIVIQDINVNDIDRFKAKIDNLSYGPNTLQIAVEDELGQKATSPSITLSVSTTENAPAMATSNETTEGTRVVSLILGCLVVSFLLVLLTLILYVIYRRRSARPRRGAGETYSPHEDSPAPGRSSAPMPNPAGRPGPGSSIPASGTSYLEIITSVSRMPPAIDLTAVEHRIGRNPKEVDIAFENDITVSRLHCAILLEGSDYRIYDKGSTSLTLVNGQKVPGFGYQLMDGDEIRLGEVVLRYRRG